ncbi:MAG: sensor histidine kinase, partial [Ignavibacteriaceae bacterium]
MTPESLFSLNNPAIYSILLLIIILVIIFTFYRYVIKPMRVHFDKEKNDITRKHLELMAAFSELDPEPVFRFDCTGNIIMTNQAGNDLDTSKYAINKPLVSIIPEVAQIDLDSCIKRNIALNIISELNGRTFQFTIRGFSRMQIGQIYGSDITELKLAEEKLKLALLKAEESEKLKTNFLSQMSHEIRSPLTAVLGFNRIVKEQYNKRSSEDLTFAFEAIEKSGKRLIRTMDQLLNMSQLQTVTYDISRQEVDLISFLKNLINEFKSEIDSKNLNIILEDELSESKIICDAYALNQIVQNILDNAIKYTSKGEIKIHLGKNSNGRIILSVSDTGIGMSEDYMKELFKPFSQEFMGYSRPFEGNG